MDNPMYEARPLHDNPVPYLQDVRYHSPQASFHKGHARSPLRGYEDPRDHPPEFPHPTNRWSPDSYSDLQARYPAFAKDLILPRKRDGTISPRDVEPWPADRADVGHGSKMQGPPAGEKPRDHYYGRKEV